MRALWYRLRRSVAQHRRLWIIGALSVLASVIGASFLAPQPAPTTTSTTLAATQYDVRWSFRQLAAQI